MTYFLLKSHFCRRNTDFYVSENIRWWKKIEIRKANILYIIQCSFVHWLYWRHDWQTSERCTSRTMSSLTLVKNPDQFHFCIASPPFKHPSIQFDWTCSTRTNSFSWKISNRSIFYLCSWLYTYTYIFPLIMCFFFLNKTKGLQKKQRSGYFRKQIAQIHRISNVQTEKKQVQMS